jgi:hypothetical protein
MYRETPFAARITFRLLSSLYDKLVVWEVQENRLLPNLIYILIK